jgi:hypothetical protein
MLIALLASAVSAFGQPSFEVTPLVGGIYGGSIKLRQDGQADRLVKLDNAVTFGVTGGFRFDGDECERCELVEFRWMRQNTYLNLDTSVPPVGPSHEMSDLMVWIRGRTSGRTLERQGVALMSIGSRWWSGVLVVQNLGPGLCEIRGAGAAKREA